MTKGFYPRWKNTALVASDYGARDENKKGLRRSVVLHMEGREQIKKESRKEQRGSKI